MIARFLTFVFAIALMGVFTGAVLAEEKAAKPGFDKKDHFAVFEGREAELAQSIAIVMKTFESRAPYDHQINDALVKFTLTSLQFAKNNDMVEEFVEHEVNTVMPILKRKAKEIAETGNLDVALDTISETGCFYQLVVDGYQKEPGKLTYVSPYKRVLDITTGGIGQHDLTEKEIHEMWTIPRFQRYAEVLGVDIHISEWNEDGVIVITVAPIS